MARLSTPSPRPKALCGNPMGPEGQDMTAPRAERNRRIPHLIPNRLLLNNQVPPPCWSRPSGEAAPFSCGCRSHHHVRRLDELSLDSRGSVRCVDVVLGREPWPTLTLVVSLEAIFLSTFVVIGQNRRAALSTGQSRPRLQSPGTGAQNQHRVDTRNPRPHTGIASATHRRIGLRPPRYCAATAGRRHHAHPLPGTRTATHFDRYHPRLPTPRGQMRKLIRNRLTV